MEFKKEFFADERREDLNEIGEARQRPDALGHVTGRTSFYNDRNFSGMLHMKIARSTQAHARIRSIDTSAAERVPGVRRIIRAADVPKNIYTILALIDFGIDDEPVLAFDKVRYEGEPIVAVVADSLAAAGEAAAKVVVDYEPMSTVFDPEEAMKPGAPLVNEYHGQNWFLYDGRDHQTVRLGDVEQGFREADHILEERYQMTPIEHAPTETQGCIAVPDTDGRFTCYTATQALFFSLENAAIILDVPSNKLHFIGGTVGGGFGGKNDTVVEPICTSPPC